MFRGAASALFPCRDRNCNMNTVKITRIDAHRYRPDRCIYTGFALEDTLHRDLSRTNEHIPPACIGGSVSVPACSKRANDAFGAAIDHLLLVSGNVQCAAMRLQGCVPSLLRRCLSVEPLVRRTAKGTTLYFLPDMKCAKRLRFVGYRPRGECDTWLPSTETGDVFRSVPELAKGWDIGDKNVLDRIEISPVEEPVSIQGGQVVSYDVEPIEFSASREIRHFFPMSIFKIGYGFLYLYIGGAVFDPCYERIREVFKRIIKGKVNTQCMDQIQRFEVTPPSDMLQFFPYHRALCRTLDDRIEVEVRLFGHLRVRYCFERVAHESEDRAVEFCFPLAGSPCKPAKRTVAKPRESGKRLYIAFPAEPTARCGPDVPPTSSLAALFNSESLSHIEVSWR